jgi:hypothetical protein
MILFGILCGIDALIALVVLFFFTWGVSDGTVSSFNIVLWMGMLGGVAALFGGGIALRAAGQRALANILLTILAARATGVPVIVSERYDPRLHDPGRDPHGERPRALRGGAAHRCCNGSRLSRLCRQPPQDGGATRETGCWRRRA